VLFGEEQAGTIKVFSASNNLYFGKEGLPYRWPLFLTVRSGSLRGRLGVPGSARRIWERSFTVNCRQGNRFRLTVRSAGSAFRGSLD
jgi:hypothetical protein